MADARQIAIMPEFTQQKPSSKPTKPSKPRKLHKQYSQTMEERIRHAEDFIKDHRFKDESKFIQTKAFVDGESKFTEDLCLGIIGGPKTGKSTLIAEILHKFQEQNTDFDTVYVTESTQLEGLRVELKKMKKCILILDNMFATHKYTSERGETWLSKFETVSKMIESRALAIVFTMNAPVYNACKATFGNKPFFKNIIRLYDKEYAMTEDFKRQILTKHERVPRDGQGSKFIEDACKHSSNFGFLFWCQSLKRKNFKEKFKESFESVSSLMGEMLSLYEKEREVLYLMLFMGGELDITLQDSDNKRRSEQLSTVFNGLRNIDPKSCCEIFEGTFLKSEKKSPNKFSFVEPVVQYVTLDNAFSKYGKIAFEWCSLDVIMGLIDLDEHRTESLSNDDLKSIAKCIRKEINVTKRTVDVVLNYKCLRYGPFLAKILPEFTPKQSHVIAKRLITKICEDGDIECLKSAMKYLQEHEEPVNVKDRSAFQATIYSEHNDDDTVNSKLEVLILNKCNYRNVDPQNGNVFHLLAENRGKKCLEFMLKFDDLNWLIAGDPNCYNRTPLHTACMEQRYDAVDFFLNNCGDRKEFVNKCDSKKRTALHYAVEYMDVEKQHRIIDLLLTSGAKTDIADDDGKIPLHEIRHCNHGVSEVVNLLLGGTKSHINTQDKCGLTPLHLATKAGNVEAVKALLKEEADVTIEDDDDEMTALMFACQECVANSTEILQLLLDAKSDMELVNRFGLTALQEAVAEGNIPCVEVLLNYGADCDKLSQNEQEETAVHIISRRPDSEAFEMFKLLLDHGADIYIRDSEKKTVFDRVSPELLSKIKNYMQDRSVTFV